MLLRRALKQRLQDEASKSASLIKRNIRKAIQRNKARRLRQRGYFHATLYLEPTATGKDDKLREHNQVEVFGEFTEHNPWGERLRASYDYQSKCFKADVLIKVG